MLRTDEEERQDRDAEARFWAEYQGKTDCLGTVAKIVVLILIVAKTLLEIA